MTIRNETSARSGAFSRRQFLQGSGAVLAAFLLNLLSLPVANVNASADVPADVIEFDPSVAYQSLEGVGANSFTFPISGDEDWEWDNVKFVFDELDLHYIRGVSWLANWESENDNDDPDTIDWSGFDTLDPTVSTEDVPFAQYLTARGISYELGVWDTAEWLANGDPRRIEPADYPELGELLAAYLLNMKANGVPQLLTEVQNEPAITARIQYDSANDLRDAGLAILDQLDAHGLGDVQLHGPNHHRPKDVGYWITPWMANERLAARTTAISYHTWWSDQFAPYDEIRQLGELYGKPVWASEIGFCPLDTGCFRGSSHLRPWTWDSAWDFAMSYYRAIAWSHASRLYHWSLLGRDSVVSETGERYPTFYILKHFANYIPPGSEYLAAESGDSQVLVLFFEHSSGNPAILINTSDETKSMRLTSSERTSLVSSRRITSTEGSYEQPGVDLKTDEEGYMPIVLPAQSVTSLLLPEVGPRLATPVALGTLALLSRWKRQHP